MFMTVYKLFDVIHFAYEIIKKIYIPRHEYNLFLQLYNANESL